MGRRGSMLVPGAAFVCAFAAAGAADRAIAQEPVPDSIPTAVDDTRPALRPAHSIGTPQYFAVIVRDLDAAVEWYREVLGLEEWIGSEAEDGRWRIVNLRSESLIVELIRHDEARTVDRAHGFFKVGFHVSDIQAFADRVERATGERPRVADFERFGLRVLQLRDPEGNVIQVHAWLEQDEGARRHGGGP